jgi:RNA polymerase sigma-70 factor (ECF subfamily)
MSAVTNDGFSPLDDRFPRILDAARAGGEWAWRELYLAIAPDLLRYFRARGVAEPEDVVGATFLRVVRNADTFAGDGGAFRAWVFTIGRNVSIDAARQRARRPEDLRDDLRDLGPTGDVEQDALQRLTRAHIEELLDGLTDDQRDVLLLRFLSDLSFAEIAQVIGKGEGAVRMIQSRGLAALRTKISEVGVTS